MAKRRRARSNLYQVDFIAALFGAFLLLWISRPTSSTGEPETAVVVMESFCDDQESLLPEGAERCVDSDILQLTDPSLSLVACVFKPVVRVTSEWKGPAYDMEGPRAATGQLEVLRKAAGHVSLVRFSGLAVVAVDAPEHKLRAVGYGPSTPPDQIRGAVYKGWINADICRQSTCPLYSGQFASDLKQKCEIRLYSRAWPQTCLKAAIQTGDASVPFDLKPCRS